MVGLLGQRDELLRTVEAAFDGTRIHVRGNEITVEGPEAERVGHLFEELVSLLEQGHWLDPTNVGHTIEMVKDDVRPSEVMNAEVGRSARGRKVHPKTAGQKRYVDAIAANTITFGIGPAGTGKSYLAVALAVQALQAKEVARIILTRPAVEAGERLGFLPGDLMAKVDPYLRPLYDALYDMLEPEGTQRLLERGAIEVAPLAFMRGRTLNGSFVILDEAQNTTPEQMKMFLTRIGFGTKVVVTGDVTQIDIAGGRSGLLDLEELLGEIEGIAFVRLGQADVVRHRIVREIVTAYDRSAQARSHRRRGRPRPGAPDVAGGASRAVDTGNGTHESVPSHLRRRPTGSCGERPGLRRRRAVRPTGRPRPLGGPRRAGARRSRDRRRRRAVAHVRRRDGHRRSQREVPRPQGPDRRAVLPDRGRAHRSWPRPRPGGERAGTRPARSSRTCRFSSATSSSARRSPGARHPSTRALRGRARPAARSRDPCTCSAWTTRRTAKPR